VQQLKQGKAKSPKWCRHHTISVNFGCSAAEDNIKIKFNYMGTTIDAALGVHLLALIIQFDIVPHNTSVWYTKRHTQAQD
jgi:hypothetical protein